MPARRSAPREFLAGVGDLGRGLRFWITSPRLMLIGAVPALIVGLVWGGLLLWLVVSLDAVAAALTPWAAAWGEPWQELARGAAAVAVLLLAVVVAVLTFTAVTLTVGDPFYERISRAVERRLGDAPPEREEALVAGLLRAARDGLRLLVASVGVSLLVFLLGLIPVAGAPIGFAVGAVLGGRLLATELTGYAFDVRGHTLRGRRRLLAGRRARTLGFGVATWLVFLVPFLAIVAMPAAVGGATALARAALPPSTDDGGHLTGG